MYLSDLNPRTLALFTNQHHAVVKGLGIAWTNAIFCNIHGNCDVSVIHFWGLMYPHLTLGRRLLKFGSRCGASEGALHTRLLLCLYSQLSLWL